MQKNLKKKGGGGAWPLIPYKNFVDHVITFNIVDCCYIELCHNCDRVSRSDSEMHRFRTRQ